MSLRVNTNVPAINTHRNLTINNTEQAKSMERLSSGLKINVALMACFLVISERLQHKLRLKQAIDNSEAGISLVQTAEAALDEVSSALINARQLAVHAANEAVNDEFMLRVDQQEIDNILATVNRIAQNTQFGKKNLLMAARVRPVWSLEPIWNLWELHKQPRALVQLDMMSLSLKPHAELR